MSLKCIFLICCHYSSVFYKMTNLGTCIICCYVDDLAFFGNKSAIDDAVKKLRQEFNMKFVGDLKEYVGCATRFENRKGQKVAYLTQPDIINKMLIGIRQKPKNIKI